MQAVGPTAIWQDLGAVGPRIPGTYPSCMPSSGCFRRLEMQAYTSAL
jgi:hypothetical protein